MKIQGFPYFILQVVGGILPAKGVHQDGSVNAWARDNSCGHKNPALLSEVAERLISQVNVTECTRLGPIPALLKLFTDGRVSSGAGRRRASESGSRSTGSRSRNRGWGWVSTGTRARGGGSAELVTHVILLLKL
jgi:hypothetical protein